ncbi:MAG TPA: tRNA pseudouridine(55) synthase TruB [Firmicutes bacterium]|nr:tRNA pseudouridine(55) synthase TruB [Bacillota bacterium]
MTGVLIIDKPADYTSFDVVAVCRRLCRERKIGHTGTLDPMATGVLPLLLGKATRSASLLEDTDKTYEAGFRLGLATDTEDVTGKVLETNESPVSRAVLEKVLPQFRGEIMQVPPMYSAVSKDGKRLYELARKGLEVEREARPVTIFQLELTEYDETAREGKLMVSCSKGTYIRTLIADLAKAAGSLGVMTSLRRTRACGFTLEDAVTLDSARELAEAGSLESCLRPVESLFAHLPEAVVSGPQAVRFQNGGQLDLGRIAAFHGTAPQDGAAIRVKSPEGVFLGLGRVELEKGQLAIWKLF